MKKISFILILAIAIVTTSCKTEEVITPANETGTVELSFEHKAGTADLELNSTSYVNEAGESFTVSKFHYYISNIQLIKEDGSYFTYPKDSSYFLIKEDVPASKSLVLRNVPVGNYKGVKFVIGVDATKSVSPAFERIGALAPSEGMYWAWNSGYIFVKLEGNSASIPTSGGNPGTGGSNPDQKFWFHIGGFGGYSSATIDNIKTKELVSSNPASMAVVKEGKSTEYHIVADILEMMKSPTAVSLAAEHHVMFRDYSTTIANNYVDMFSLDHFHNP